MDLYKIVEQCAHCDRKFAAWSETGPSGQVKEIRCYKCWSGVKRYDPNFFRAHASKKVKERLLYKGVK